MAYPLGSLCLILSITKIKRQAIDGRQGLSYLKEADIGVTLFWVCDQNVLSVLGRLSDNNIDLCSRFRITQTLSSRYLGKGVEAPEAAAHGAAVGRGSKTLQVQHKDGRRPTE